MGQLFFLIILLDFSLPAFASRDPFYQLNLHWKMRRDLIESKKFDNADDRLGLIEKEKIFCNIRNLDHFSLGLIIESQEYKKDDILYAIKTAQWAIDLSPDLAEAYFNKALLLLEKDYNQFINVSQLLVLGVNAFFRSPSSDAFRLNLFWILIVAMLLTIMMISLGLALKYCNHLVAEQRKDIPFPYLIEVLFGVTTWVTALSTIQYGPLSLFFIATVLFFKYYTKRERVFTLFILVFLLTLPVSLRFFAPMLQFKYSKYYDAYRINRGDYTADTFARFLEHRSGSDPVLDFIKANALKISREYDHAETLYKELLARNFQKNRVKLNLANLYFETGREQEGFLLYNELEKSVKSPSILATLFFNKSRNRAQKNTLRTMSATNEALDKASSSDWSTTNVYANLVRKNPDVGLMDLRFSDKILSKTMKKQSFTRSGAQTVFWQTLPFPLNAIKLYDLILFSIGCLVLCLTTIIAGIARFVPFNCQRCGKIVLSDDILNKNQTTCKTCYEIIVLKKSLPDKARIENDFRTQRHFRRYYLAIKAISVFVFDFSSLKEDKITRVFLRTLIIFLLLVASLSQMRFIDPIEIHRDWIFPKLVAMTIAAALYTFSVIPAFKKRWR